MAVLRLLVISVAFWIGAGAALAQSGPAIAYTTANLNVRAGPGTNYPVITTLPRGAGVTVFGCTADFKWCDAAFTNVKGWVSGRYLSYAGAGPYYGRPVPNAGVQLGVRRYYGNYPVYGRPPVVQPIRPIPGRVYRP
ncbi:MAG: SH3 domain-containing protein [Roseibium sp.]|nr:SH3 domain-containing protein [Roseibium sp.]